MSPLNAGFFTIQYSQYYTGFPGGSDGKASASNAGDPGLIPGSRRSHGGEGMATHSSILVWKIPGTAEPGGLQPMGSQRVGHTHSPRKY